MRAAMVGGGAYYAGKKVQQGREQNDEQDARLDAVESDQTAPAAAPAPAASGAGTSAMLDQLEKLGELKKQGVLTDAEFEVQKQKLLEGA
jgi:Short C-terminal domain